MKKAHVLAEDPFDPTKRAEVFVTGSLMIEFIGSNWLGELDNGGNLTGKQAMFRGEPIRLGNYVIGRTSDPATTLAEYAVDSVTDAAEEADVPVEHTYFG